MISAHMQLINVDKLPGYLTMIKTHEGEAKMISDLTGPVVLDVARRDGHMAIYCRSNGFVVADLVLTQEDALELASNIVRSYGQPLIRTIKTKADQDTVVLFHGEELLAIPTEVNALILVSRENGQDRLDRRALMERAFGFVCSDGFIRDQEQKVVGNIFELQPV